MKVDYLKAGDPTIVARCRAGDAVVVEQFLQALDIHQLIQDTLLQVIQARCGQACANALRASGLESIHEHIPTTTLADVVTESERQVAKQYLPLMRSTVRKGLALQHPVWVLRHSILRMHAPHDSTARQAGFLDEFRKTYGVGRLTSLRPHRDSWFAEPSASINIWIALGNVQQGNGLSIYPEKYHQHLPFKREVGVLAGQSVGKPMNFNLSPGDALFFHANHLHASELNHTQETRVVLSLRVALEKPGSSTRRPQRYTRIEPDSTLSWIKLHPLIKPVAQRLSRHGARFHTLFRRGPAGPATNTADNFPVATGHPQAALSRLDADKIEPGKPLVISRKRCLVKLHNGEFYAFNRYCPHEGADMALSYLEGDSLRCPWHNLPFDLHSGFSPCKTLQGLSIEKCQVKDNRVIIE